ncbi:hypothetical protein [Vibrio coralliilyticus]|nr:hypothetical protein [Vibrio coralliilyticus]
MIRELRPVVAVPVKDAGRKVLIVVAIARFMLAKHLCVHSALVHFV